MGNNLLHVFNNNVNSLFSKKLQIVMLGLDNSGKTTLLYRMKLKKDIHKTIPTTAFNVETIRPTKSLKFMVWDTAGHDIVRPLWRAYIRKSDAILFVIDSSDPDRFDEARVELDQVLGCDDSNGIPLLILANKQDLSTAFSPIQISRLLELDNLEHSVDWHLQPTSGRFGEGLHDVLLQLSAMIAKKRERIATNKPLKPQSFERSQASKFV